VTEATKLLKRVSRNEKSGRNLSLPDPPSAVVIRRQVIASVGGQSVERVESISVIASRTFFCLPKSKKLDIRISLKPEFQQKQKNAVAEIIETSFVRLGGAVKFVRQLCNSRQVEFEKI